MDKEESSLTENEMDIPSAELPDDTAVADSSQESMAYTSSEGFLSVACQTEESPEAILKKHEEMEALREFNARLEKDNEILREMIKKKKEKTKKLQEEIEASKRLQQMVLSPEKSETEVDLEKVVELLDRQAHKRKK
ncbi:uncharacterized protein LOC129957591 [Argiope bruennichi]|uniref:Uncharacterized protein n=1 Tax=Argiope bruennichi TaxID=94029 RepID=A0A8T0FC54_ARGBR|nr:uncharacterized protein LOC129957591 [Argiope bruennichi]XP_055925981.1 uncharacterized protein LOC129957591 [Argiope bruennichi]KAF8788726.1 hypothetical protein HNY73_006734 [Argiope bruennichi]